MSAARGHLRAVADLWRCHLCHRDRPAHEIGAFSRDVGPELGSELEVMQTVHFCLDNPDCRGGAQTFLHGANERST